jgi:hypothetical protein
MKKEDQNKYIRFDHAAAQLPLATPTPAAQQCVKCSHIKLNPWGGYCQHEVSPFGKRPVRYCGCKCEFPTGVSADDAEKQAREIVEMTFPPDAVPEAEWKVKLIHRIAAALRLLQEKINNSKGQHTR